MHGTFGGDGLYLHYLRHSLVSGQTTVTPIKKNWIKVLLSMAHQNKIQFTPQVNLSIQEASISLVYLSVRGQTE